MFKAGGHDEELSTHRRAYGEPCRVLPCHERLGPCLSILRRAEFLTHQGALPYPGAMPPFPGSRHAEIIAHSKIMAHAVFGTQGRQQYGCLGLRAFDAIPHFRKLSSSPLSPSRASRPCEPSTLNQTQSKTPLTPKPYGVETLLKNTTTPERPSDLLCAQGCQQDFLLG